MLTIFFIIVFIAELIVAGKVISVLKECSATVCSINNQVTETKSAVSKSVQSVSSGVKSAAKTAGLMTKFLEKRRRDAIIALTKGVAGIVIFLLIFPSFRCFVSFIYVIVLYTAQRVFMAKKGARIRVDSGSLGEVCSGSSVAAAENSEQIEE